MLKFAMTTGPLNGKDSIGASRESSGPPPSCAHVVDTYRRYAPIYDRVFGAVLEPGRRALARAASGLGNGSLLSLLEIGVGTGLTLPLYSPSIRITAVDVSAPMLAKARERAAQLPTRDIRLSLMDGERLDFPDGAFDCVALPYVLSVTPDPARLVAEVRRVCRRGGTILVLNHFTGSNFWWLLERIARPMADRIGFRSDFDFEQQILRHDWSVQAVQEVNLLGLSKLVTIRNS
jgi:phosphatidylethanolamine/phosphatidyl-N-methylethanolamine N-methyltransferase